MPLCCSLRNLPNFALLLMWVIIRSECVRDFQVRSFLNLNDANRTSHIITSATSQSSCLDYRNLHGQPTPTHCFQLQYRTSGLLTLTPGCVSRSSIRADQLVAYPWHHPRYRAKHHLCRNSQNRQLRCANPSVSSFPPLLSPELTWERVQSALACKEHHGKKRVLIGFVIRYINKN